MILIWNYVICKNLLKTSLLLQFNIQFISVSSCCLTKNLIIKLENTDKRRGYIVTYEFNNVY